MIKDSNNKNISNRLNKLLKEGYSGLDALEICESEDKGLYLDDLYLSVELAKDEYYNYIEM